MNSDQNSGDTCDFFHAMEVQRLQRSKLIDKLLNKIVTAILSQVTSDIIILQEFKRNYFANVAFILCQFGSQPGKCYRQPSC